MADHTSLVPVRSSELNLGKPAPWHIYNEAGKLLLARGTMIDTPDQLAGLIENGLYRNARWIAEPDTESVPLPQARDVLRKKHGGKKPHKPKPALRGQASVIPLDDVRWQIGDTVWLQLADDAAQRHAVTLVGCLSNRSILVSAPQKEGKQIFLREGQAFVVRALTGRRAYAFASQLLKYQHSPFVYLHLSAPREVRSTVIRQATRVPVGAEGYLEVDGSTPLPASVIDLSLAGASLVATSLKGRVEAKKGVSGTLRFIASVADQQLPLELPVVLRAVESLGEADFHQYGVEFAPLTVRDKLVLSAYVYQELTLQE
ncbi:glycosyltransferase [Herbaspirillum rubrisubalbicans]|jgi:c-di-GMP-binding flagellar brake protein YcgR|uniref:Glycosyltransferase n=2 Tax=Herbaspirillum rubrisubalbicans TaxID=80842 RepID=A0ABX9C308_9BURK|nr:MULTISPECIES: flagellar brake protein [Herbaspirillum]MCP1573320.1 c-di-GMP-binding flagellar brake protein YcgR [Herbaspirillum rubrisubalbicans]NQE47640.1 glycosyltransferase [Herbaspirillum rubrisubalbicans]QJQ01820.1 flagellar brake protein [Herbaspirillum rubrisubalbicans Os34]RAM64894.1 glycosyltransferase [Herbaspirillum rubrisubalbicans]RAN48143.1 glycosyltransferase [Herbaspirillum rubrisubalbicans]